MPSKAKLHFVLILTFASLASFASLVTLLLAALAFVVFLFEHLLVARAIIKSKNQNEMNLCPSAEARVGLAYANQQMEAPKATCACDYRSLAQACARTGNRVTFR
jgi:hypothetical protein